MSNLTPSLSSFLSSPFDFLPLILPLSKPPPIYLPVLSPFLSSSFPTIYTFVFLSRSFYLGIIPFLHSFKAPSSFLFPTFQMIFSSLPVCFSSHHYSSLPALDLSSSSSNPFFPLPYSFSSLCHFPFITVLLFPTFSFSIGTSIVFTLLPFKTIPLATFSYLLLKI